MIVLNLAIPNCSNCKWAVQRYESYACQKNEGLSTIAYVKDKSELNGRPSWCPIMAAAKLLLESQ